MSVYKTPNVTMPDFRGRLDALEDAVLGMEGQILVGGGFNTASRGKRILEMAVRPGLAVLNTGSTPTFRRPDCERSIPDITFASEFRSPFVDGWRGLEDFLSSDHQYIAFEGVGLAPRLHANEEA